MLCYHYEGKWNPSHVCKIPKVYLLQAKYDKMNEEELKEIQEVTKTVGLVEQNDGKYQFMLSQGFLALTL